MTLNTNSPNNNMKHDLTKDRMYGCLYGQAVGNALGILTEFMNKRQLARNYPNGLRHYKNDIGVWEDDDTNQMLCILDELVENGEIIPKSLAKRFLNWLETDGRGCGHLVYRTLISQNYINDPYNAAYESWERMNRDAAPNGALMRTSVIGLLPENVVENTQRACKVTHYDPRCIGSCVIATEIIHNLVWNNRELTLDEIKAIGRKYDDRIEEWIELAYQCCNTSLLDLTEPHSIGYTLRSLAAALWCYFHAADFESGLIAIVNEGGDADTNAAIACSILGAKFGYNEIPRYYIENLQNGELYRRKIEKFINKISIK